MSSNRLSRTTLRWGMILLGLSPLRLVAADSPQYIQPNSQTGTSAAVVVGDVPLVHTAQIFPELRSGRDARAQIHEVLTQLDRVLANADSALELAVKLNVYVTGQDVADALSGVLAERFAGERKPALSLVVTPLPEDGAMVAVDAVAMTRHTRVAQVQQGGKEVAIVPAGSRFYISGQAERAESLREATRKTLESLRTTLKFLGRRDADVAQVKAFVMPMSEADMVRREIADFFGSEATPPTVLVEWKSSTTTPIEIELVAWGGTGDLSENVQARSPEPVAFLTPQGMTASPIFSRVTRIHRSPTIYISGLYAGADESSAADPTRPESGEREVKEIFAALEGILDATGSDFRHLVKATYYVGPDAAANAKLNELRPSYYDPQRPPAASKAPVAAVGRPGLGLTIDMIAVPKKQQ